MSPRTVAAALAGPALATLVTGGFAVLEIAGREPLSSHRPANIAEAAGLGIGAEVLRFLRTGADPTRVYPVDPEIISSSITRATALEAVIWSRQVELVRMLDREGALPNGPERQRLACLAHAIAIESIQAYLAPEGLAPCDPDVLVAGIQARQP